MKQKYTVSGEIDPQLVIGTIPDPVVGLAYDETLIVAGGVPPYLLDSGSIPTGMTLEIVPTGVRFHGTPTVTGPWSFTVEDSGK